MGYFDDMNYRVNHPGLSQDEINNQRINNIKKDFKKIHGHIVDVIVAFCKEYNIDCDECMIDINNVQFSIDNGKIDNLWMPMTSSSLVLAKYNEMGELKPVLKSS